MWNRTWQTYSSVTQVVYSGAQESTSKWKKSYFCWWRKSWLFFLITLFMNMKNWTILLFSGSLSKICCTKLDLLQDIRKFYGALFDVHGFLKYERRHQSVAFNSLATQWVGEGGTHLLRQTRMCRSNGSLFYQKSFNMGPVFLPKKKSFTKKLFAFPEGFSDQTRYISRLL